MKPPVQAGPDSQAGLWFKVVLPTGALGPGKADLLAAIDHAGSISGAGRAMGMSYKRAWSLVERLNALMGAPLVQAGRGGGPDGGARLTPLGREVLELYRDLARDLDAASTPWVARLLALRE